MRFFLAFWLVLALSLFPFLSTANAEDISIDDLLTPDFPLTNEKVAINEELTQKPKQEGQTLDELLGPEDIFPFLPDNHRDSGTGKFNSF